MKIVELTAENVKKIKAVSIKPDGSLVIIGGNNGQGKSSVLDSIMMVLGGKNYSPDVPVRKGQKKGFVDLDLGNLVVRRTFTESGGGTLVIKNKEGATYPSPQTILEELVGKISFDPLSFLRQKPKEQLETLKNITGVDFTGLDLERVNAYDTRRVANNNVKRMESIISGLECDEDAPDKEISVSDLMDELAIAKAGNYLYSSAKNKVMAQESVIKDIERQLEDLKDRLKIERVSFSEFADDAVLVKETDVKPIEDQIYNAEKINIAVRRNREHEIMSENLIGHTANSNRLTKVIEDIDIKKKGLVADAKMPVDGLSLSDDGVLLNDLPFKQASSTDQLKTSVAMGIAANPKLKVLLIKDGPWLDDKNLEIMGIMAEEEDAQIWIERVGNSAEMSVIMEDGMVKNMMLDENGDRSIFDDVDK